MRAVGNLVSQIGELRLQAGLAPGHEAMAHIAGLLALQAQGVALAAMLQDAFTGLKAQVQAIEGRVACLQLVHDPQALQVVLEAAVLAHAIVQRVLPGMAERGMAQVVGQGDGLDQVLVQPQATGDGAAELGDLQRMRQPGAEQVALMVDKDLGLVDQAAERGAVDHPIAVALEVVTQAHRRLGMEAATRPSGVAGVTCQALERLARLVAEPLTHCGH